MIFSWSWLFNYKFTFSNFWTKSKNASIVENGACLISYLGMSQTTDSSAIKLVGEHYYEKMFNETFLDLLSFLVVKRVYSSSFLVWYLIYLIFL